MRSLNRVPGVVLVSLAAAMWGLDGLIRKPLSDSTSAYTIVFGEHVVLVALTLPLLAAAFTALWRAGWPYVGAGIMVGAGASAIATIRPWATVNPATAIAEAVGAVEVEVDVVLLHVHHEQPSVEQLTRRELGLDGRGRVQKAGLIGDPHRLRLLEPGDGNE